MQERIVGLLVASTPIEAFQRKLLGRAKGYTLTDTLAVGRRFEAVLAGRQEIQKRANIAEQHGPSSTTLRQLWSSPFTKTLSDIQTRVGSAGKSDTVVESIHQDPVRQTETRVGSAGKSDAVVESIHRDPVRHTETHVGSAGKSDTVVESIHQEADRHTDSCRF